MPRGCADDARRAPPARQDPPADRGRRARVGGELGVGRLKLTALAGLPEVRPGDDLAALIADAAPEDLAASDVLVGAQKVVSKAEGRGRRPADGAPGGRARAPAGRPGE